MVFLAIDLFTNRKLIFFSNIFKSFYYLIYYELRVMHGVKRLLWWLLSGSVGGFNRGRILEELFKQPRNANELAKVLNLDYKTIRYHLCVLEKNNMAVYTGSRYGKMYFPSDLIEKNIEYFKEIWGKIGKKNK